MEWIVEAESMNDVLNGHMVTFKRLIRCKNCKFYGKDYMSREDIQFCYEHGRYLPEDYFCSAGEWEEHNRDSI